MPKPEPEPEFDATRLLSLAKARDTRRAYARSLAEKYQTAREERQDVTRRLALARQNADLHRHGFRAESDAQIALLEAQERELTSRLYEIQAEQDCIVGEASEAASLFKSCLDFAHGRGLPIPAQLVEQAKPRNFAPLGAVGGAA
ncbi:hypothetical protein [Tabrizicola aquatica]|uniref:hypothetical protein n=1 Tax=Tabrizicola aquatica TaxID=909926 RepID=UPI000CD2CDC1|nr:hypothetical protein [Tabrizicola aquatica]